VIVKLNYAELARDVRPGEEAPYTEFYLISRQGTGKLVAYAVEIGLSNLLEAASTESDVDRRSVVEVLDGELVRENDGQIRYLIFDALIHLGRDICPLPLRERLECATNLLRCSEMLGVPSHRIEVRVKDFFRLCSPKFNMVEFLLKKYVKCLPHENDGIIFNHEEKPYLRGTTNNGYIKWKPAHLNTVDFMIVPNLNLEEVFGRRILDLYLAVHDPRLEVYTRQFYAFAVVAEADFTKFHEIYTENENRVAQEEM
jgi:ATP-dependent DNA ligase